MSEDKNATKQVMLVAFVEQLGKIPAVLLSTKEGVGLVSMMTGAVLKSIGAGESLQLRPEFRGSENWLEEVYYPAIKKDGIQGPNEEQEFCKRHPASASGAPFCDVHNSLTVDVFPFNLKIAGINIMHPDFGKASVPDLMISGGFMAMSADFIAGALKGIGEIVPG